MKKILFLMVSAVVAVASQFSSVGERIASTVKDDNGSYIEKRGDQSLILEPHTMLFDVLASHSSHSSHRSHSSHSSHSSHRSHVSHYSSR